MELSELNKMIEGMTLEQLKALLLSKQSNAQLMKNTAQTLGAQIETMRGIKRQQEYRAGIEMANCGVIEEKLKEWL